jgi:hypothetical protein
MSTRFDTFMQRLPGSVAAKSLGFSVLVCAALAYPVYKSTEGRQGHDYLSSEKPEVVASGQEKLRREQRLNRNNNNKEGKEDGPSSP